MIRVALSETDALGYSYWIAGRKVVASAAVDALVAFAQGDPAVGIAVSQTLPPPQRHEDAGPRRTGSVLLNGASHTVECDTTAAGYRVEVPDAATFEVSADGSEVRLVARHGGPELLAAALLGPAFYLALAAQGTWCLHAASVETRVGAVVFVGPSGAGKSTLARHLAAASPRYRLLSDEVLPLMMSAATGPVALPHYPQFRLPSRDQLPPPPATSESWAVAAVFTVDEVGADAVPAIEAMAGGDAVSAMVMQTLGASLFDRSLATRHMAAMADFARRTWVQRLRYPHAVEALPATIGLLQIEIAGLERARALTRDLLAEI